MRMCPGSRLGPQSGPQDAWSSCVSCGTDKLGSNMLRVLQFLLIYMIVQYIRWADFFGYLYDCKIRWADFLANITDYIVQ